MIRAGQPAPQESDAATDRWLREEVVPVMQAALANPGTLIPLDEVFAEIGALHAEHA